LLTAFSRFSFFQFQLLLFRSCLIVLISDIDLSRELAAGFRGAHQPEQCAPVAAGYSSWQILGHN